MFGRLFFCFFFVYKSGSEVVFFCFFFGGGSTLRFLLKLEGELLESSSFLSLFLDQKWLVRDLFRSLGLPSSPAGLA